MRDTRAGKQAAVQCYLRHENRGIYIIHYNLFICLKWNKHGEIRFLTCCRYILVQVKK